MKERKEEKNNKGMRMGLIEMSLMGARDENVRSKFFIHE